jgi:hypothetical protein
MQSVHGSRHYSWDKGDNILGKSYLPTDGYDQLQTFFSFKYFISEDYMFFG